MEILTWAEALHRHGAAWAELVREEGLNPSLGPEWMGAALGSHDLTDVTRVAVMQEGRSLSAVLPLVLRRGHMYGIPVVLADLASNLVSYHAALIARTPSADQLSIVLDEALAGCWHVFRAYNVPDGSSTASALQGWARQRDYTARVLAGERSPYIAIRSDWATFLGGQPKKFRSNVVRVLRKSEEGGATMRWFTALDGCQELLQGVVHIEERSWKAAEGIAIPSRPAELEYYRRLIPHLARSGALLANVLYLDAVPTAYVLCCMANGWFGQLKTSFREDARDAGSSVITASVMRSFELGATEYDFLGDADPHKLRWTSSVRPHSSHFVMGRTARARLVAGANRLISSLRAVGG